MPTATAAEPGKACHFTMDTTPEPLRALRFQKEMQSTFAMHLAISSPPATPLTADVRGYFGRRLRFAALRFSAHSTASTRTRHASESRLLVSCHRQGAAVVTQGGRESRIEAGDFFVIDPSRPFHIQTTDSEVHSVYLEPQALRQVLPHWDMLTARAIRPDVKTAALFTGLLDQLFAMAPDIGEDMADDISEALPHLLAPALRTLQDEADASPSRLKALHRQRIRAYVRDHLWDSQLSAQAIAQGVNLSPRHVYELFDERDGLPLMKSVWKQRLAMCRRDLAAPALRSRSIGEIAYAWGFSNVSHFSRAFKAEFGIGPREFRRARELAGTVPAARH
ncbi:helix-turn-helix domain-containing protein [Hydrogenophaga pseudoflava]|uniref:helix-turn-helix domain-containing protein n=1 Tax=Hydrogenophaga pseudoflava TaxID=47421 RepID=UPI0027E4E905|nr:helix-turn-helix domain-containing protein [Hydrogenophaga pseudoflava]MDQ7743077.1 helix-turn-helix domain-containing protein [Hydrogenophaga pseudoflava]